MLTTKTVRLKSKYSKSYTRCTIKKSKYPSGQTRLDAIDVRTGEPYAVLTVALPDLNIPKDMVIIKNYSENEGMLDQLIQQKIVKPVSYTNTGFVYVDICKLLI